MRTNPTLLDTSYLVLALGSEFVRNQIEIPIRSTVGLKNINAAELGSLTIPLPPLNEQHRIVAKLDQLMSLCDRLAAQIASGETASSRLLDRLLHDALALPNAALAD
jgi:type I restriction enzyme, S subunit